MKETTERSFMHFVGNIRRDLKQSMKTSKSGVVEWLYKDELGRAHAKEVIENGKRSYYVVQAIPARTDAGHAAV